MERKHIRWGELVGGLLIVGCSIALVLSFWAQIQQHPLMKFTIFTAVTAALFMVGLYSQHRWKLPTTSHGILLIATLLVPLNFLAFAAFSHGVSAADPISMGGEAIALVLFLILVAWSARVLAPRWPALLAAGVMALSAGTLAVRYLSVSTGEAELSAVRVIWLSAVVVGCYAAASAGILAKARRGKSLDAADANAADANAALLSLAVLSFAAVISLALIVNRGGAGSLHHMAPLIGLAGLPALVGGVLLRARITTSVGLRVAVTGVTVAGAAILFGAIALAWPDPAEMLAASVVAFVALFAVALMETSGLWLNAAQAAAALATAAGVVFRLDRGATGAAADWIGTLLADLAAWRIIAVAWGALSLAWGLLRFSARTTVIDRPLLPPTVLREGAGEGIGATAPLDETPSRPSPGVPREGTMETNWLDSARALAQFPHTFDRLMNAALLVVLGAVAIFATSCGAASELAPLGQGFGGIQPGSFASGIIAATAGAAPWLLLALMLAAHIANAWEELRTRVSHWGLIIAWVACPLWAAHWLGTGGVESAFRWSVMGYLILAAGVVWWRAAALGPMLNRSSALGATGKRTLLPVGPLADRAIPRTSSASSGDLIDALLLLLGVAPIVTLSLCATTFLFWGDLGPGRQTVLDSAGRGINFVVPLIFVAIFLIGQGLRHRSNGYLCAGLLSINLLVSIAYVAAAGGNAGGGLDDAHIVRLMQLNIVTTAATLLALFALRSLHAKPLGRNVPVPAILEGAAWAVLASNGVLIFPAAGELFLFPGTIPSLAAQAGSVWGWVALGLATSAVVCVTVQNSRSPLKLAGFAFSMIAALVAFTVSAWDRGNWLTYHVWMGAQTVVAWAIIGLGWWFESRGLGGAQSLGPNTEPATISDEVPMGAPGDAIPTGAGIAVADRAFPPPSVLRGKVGDATVARLDETFTRPSPVLPGDETEGPGTPPPSQNQLDYHLALPPSVPSPFPLIRISAARWAGVLGLLAIVLAIRAAAGDPAAPWPSGSVMVFIALLIAALAVWTRTPARLYPATILVNAAATLVYWVDPGPFGGWSVMGFVEINVAALSLAAIAWLVLELHVFRRMEAVSTRWLPIHHFGALVSVGALGAATALCVAGPPMTFSSDVPLLTDLIAIVAAATILIACLWDEPPISAVGLLYLLGLIACGRALERFNIHTAVSPRRPWLNSVVLAGYGVLTGALWEFRDRLRRLADRLGLPPVQTHPRSRNWLAQANLMLAVAVLTLAFISDFTLPRLDWRLLPSVAALAQVIAVSFGAKAGRLREATILAGVAGLLAAGWAFLDPNSDAQGLQHAALACALLTAAVIECALVFSGKTPRRTAWAAAARDVSPILVGLCLASLAVCLGTEGLAQILNGQLQMPAWAIAAVAAASGVCCVAAILLAVRPIPAPPGETAVYAERWQASCVYAAEALLAALFAHIRLTLPFLFHGFLRQFWPLVVMAIAFAGVGIGEVLRRRGRRTLAGPLQNTAVFLPLLPVLAFWAASSKVDYSVLLLLVGALYASLAFLRHSMPYALLAAFAGNGSLWYLLSRSESLGFFAHPQVWVIPAALSGLIAVERNRAGLSAVQLRAARYFCVVILYLSSTADIFINGSAHSPWLPLALAGLSVAGVLIGVALRVRPFLFLGTTFLTLSIIAMIYNASASLHITWIWYVAGILLGLFIIVLFALFEKKRSAMLALVEGLKAWQ